MLSDVSIGKLTGGTHLFVEVKEKMSAGRQLAVQGIDRGARVRRVVQNAVRNDEVEALIGERQIHEVCLHERCNFASAGYCQTS